MIYDRLFPVGRKFISKDWLLARLRKNIQKPSKNGFSVKCSSTVLDGFIAWKTKNFYHENEQKPRSNLGKSKI
jgi:hypothetical protein